ncbi:MAG: metallophosphoesterase family protein [Candidatus Hodarchaeales archaeon]
MIVKNVAKLKTLITIVIVFLLITGVSNIQDVNGKITADDPVSWTPSIPNVGEEVTIFYDPSATNAVLTPSAENVSLVWGMYVRGNQLLTNKPFGAVPPSPEMWPEETEVLAPYRFAKSPMTKDETSGLWSISILLNDKPDYLTCYFEDAIGNQDKNNNAYWLVNSQLLEDRISVLSPTFAEPLILVKSSGVVAKVNASITASNWQLTLSGVGNPIEPPITSVFNSGVWEISFTAPSGIGLYDMNFSALLDGNIQFDWEPNSLKVIETFKSSYTFAVFGDPQFHRDGSAGYAYRSQQTGIGNFTKILQEVNIVNPEFILVVGDLTEWTDEIALSNFKKWCNLYLDDIPVISIMGNHGDFEGTASLGIWEWGSGRGMWNNVIGPSTGIFRYGTHAFVRGDSSDRQYDVGTGIESYNFVMDSLDEISSAEMKFLMLHHPLVTYGESDPEPILSSTESDAIVSKLQSIDADAYFHGHYHANLYTELGNLLHIGTTETGGDQPGYRLVEVENNAITKYKYDIPNPTDANYGSLAHAPSNPIENVSLIYSDANDGSLTSLSATINNTLAHNLSEAHVRFQMVSGVYESDIGEIESQFTEGAITHVDVRVKIESNSSQIVTVTKIGELPTTTTEVPTTTTTTELIETTTTTTSEGSSGYLLLEFLLLIPVFFIYRRSKRS